MSVSASMSWVFRLSDRTIARQLLTSVSLVLERKYRGEDCCVTYSTRIRSADRRHRPYSLSGLAPTRRKVNGHFHRRFYEEYLHASRLTFNLVLIRREKFGNSRRVLRRLCGDCCSPSISEQSLPHRRSAFSVDCAASISASGRPVRVLAELVWICSANVFGHAKSTFKFILHCPGRHIPWLERAGNAWRFPRSSSRGHARHVLFGAAPLRFTT